MPQKAEDYFFLERVLQIADMWHTLEKLIKEKDELCLPRGPRNYLKKEDKGKTN